MIFHLILAVALGLPLLAAPGPAPDMATESHHKLLLANDSVRVFAVTIPPQQEAVVRHEHNFLTVTLKDCDIVMWGKGESPVMHFQVPAGESRFYLAVGARGLRNDSSAEYRNVTVEFLDPRVTSFGYRTESGKWDYGPSALGASVDPHSKFVNSLDLQTTIVNDVQLLPDDTLPAPHAASRELLIAVTPLDLAAGDAKIHLAPGEIRWLEGRSVNLVNVWKLPDRFVLIRFK